MKFAQSNLVVNGDMSADVYSDWVKIDQIFGYFLQAVYTGSPNGNLLIQVSGDITDDPANIVNFDTLGSSTVAISSPGISSYNITNQFCKWFRIKFDHSSGSGVLNVTYNAKG